MPPRRQEAADAPPMAGQTSWTNTGSLPRPEPIPERHAIPEPEAKSPAQVDAVLTDLEQRITPEKVEMFPVSNAGGKPAKAKREMDPMLRAAAKLDRLLAEMPAAVRSWALGYMAIKYSEKNRP